MAIITTQSPLALHYHTLHALEQYIYKLASPVCGVNGLTSALISLNLGCLASPTNLKMMDSELETKQPI